MSRARGPQRRAGTPRGGWRAYGLPLLVLGVLTPALYGLQGAFGASSGNRVVAYDWQLPKDFPGPRVPGDNPMTKEKVALGRQLFFDERLSGNATQSCASCHRPELAFTDGRTTSIGSTGEAHPRNAQSLVNVAFQSTLTWANPALVTLEQQMEVPLFGTEPIEMGITDANKAQVLKRLQRDPAYRVLFRRAFPGPKRPVSYRSVIRALASFQRSIIAAGSRYDRYLRGKGGLTTSQERGMQLFNGEQGECHHCHGSFIFNDQTSYVGAPEERPAFHNTGLFNIGGTGDYPEGGRGLFELTGRPQDMGRFKAPSLRNVAVTAPYMHDGSIATLPEVIEHYAAGGRTIAEGPNAGDGSLNPFKDPEVSRISLDAQDKADLVAFLGALTDKPLLRDPRFSDPGPRVQAPREERRRRSR